MTSTVGLSLVTYCSVDPLPQVTDIGVYSQLVCPCTSISPTDDPFQVPSTIAAFAHVGPSTVTLAGIFATGDETPTQHALVSPSWVGPSACAVRHNRHADLKKL